MNRHEKVFLFGCCKIMGDKNASGKCVLMRGTIPLGHINTEEFSAKNFASFSDFKIKPHLSLKSGFNFP